MSSALVITKPRINGSPWVNPTRKIIYMMANLKRSPTIILYIMVTKGPVNFTPLERTEIHNY